MDILIKAAQFIVCLSLLIIVHEFGHFLFSRLFKVRVEKFYLFFNLWGSLLRAKKVNGKWQFAWFSKSAPKSWKDSPETTEWGIGWLPLGGYCKIAGMIDESLDVEQMKQEPKPWEFRSQPTGKRLLIMVGGVLFNVIFAMLIYSGILFKWGENHIANNDLEYGVVAGPLADSIGIKTGDKIHAIDGEEVTYFDNIPVTIIREQAKTITVERDGKQLELPIPTSIRIKLRKSSWGDFFPFVINSFADESPARNAGCMPGDTVVGVNNQKLRYFSEISKVLGENKGKPIELAVKRGDSLITIPLTISKKGQIGVFPLPQEKFISYRIPYTIAKLSDTSAAHNTGFMAGDRIVGVNGQEALFYNEVQNNLNANRGKIVELSVMRGDSLLTLPLAVAEDGTIGADPEDIKRTHINYGLFESIPAGIVKGYQGIGNYIKDIRLVFSSEDKAYTDVGGFIMIANVFPALWDWHAFWSLCALLSIMLAVVNLLPIPMLDGGHVLFLLYEVVTRRKPSDKFMEYAQLVGLIIVFGLIIFSNGNDILRLLNLK